MNLRRVLALALPLVTTTIAALTPTGARACWDGIAVSSDRVVLGIDTPASWTPEGARHWAKWLGRLDALVPAGKQLVVMQGAIEICDDGHENCREAAVGWDDGSAFTLFQIAVALFEPNRQQVAQARRAGHVALTVQVAATFDLAAAQALAVRINDAELELAGFYDVGGFPSTNDVAHVVERVTDDGVRYEVVVGAFLDRAQAREALAVLDEALTLDGFVRPLDQRTSADEGC